MKKILIYLLCVILFGCYNNQKTELVSTTENQDKPFDNVECYEVGMKWNGHLKYTSGPFYELNVIEKTTDLKSLLVRKDTITILKINSLKLKELPEELLLFTNLEALDISDNPFQNLEKLISDLSKFPRLQLLAMNHCGIVELPDNLSRLNNLIGLALNQNEGLKNISKVHQLDKLKYLDISGNKKLKDLPDDIGSLKCLEQIVMGGSGIIRLRDELTYCINLREITANACKIKELPINIGNLKKLKKLNLGANRIELIPESIGELSELDYLSLGTNDIFYLPESISNLRELYSISLELNRFRAFPREVLKLRNLRYLDLHNNNFKDVPIEVADLPNLTRVYVDHELISDDNIEVLRNRNPDLEVESRDALRLVPNEPKRKN
ncbi:leucine-rich repeat domain-containing protein [Winogradskyella sp. PG-2]|uniref:leucine-rich repeat domain-containing protein n=1 Tax=Winogradskyella sp. PG-2 TaxID=754409 RepID=UPI00045861EC|nr:leucine-rich repeat domain-containing protein [Winogradskyella sp. PG-2]BAO75948.1 hypothetical protein WPG_1718 [Winogradskyella sp. PG-2]